jgi:hypothetical protein
MASPASRLKSQLWVWLSRRGRLCSQWRRRWCGHDRRRTPSRVSACRGAAFRARPRWLLRWHRPPSAFLHHMLSSCYPITTMENLEPNTFSGGSSIRRPTFSSWPRLGASLRVVDRPHRFDLARQTRRGPQHLRCELGSPSQSCQGVGRRHQGIGRRFARRSKTSPITGINLYRRTNLQSNPSSRGDDDFGIVP